MKSLAELIAELQEIPNPEKVMVTVFDGDFNIPIEQFEKRQTSSLAVLLEGDAVRAKSQGFESVVTF